MSRRFQKTPNHVIAMILPQSDNRREMGFTLWIIGWLTSLPCLAMPREGTGWPMAALVSLGLVAAGLYLVREGSRSRRLSSHEGAARPPGIG